MYSKKRNVMLRFFFVKSSCPLVFCVERIVVLNKPFLRIELKVERIYLE